MPSPQRSSARWPRTPNRMRTIFAPSMRNPLRFHGAGKSFAWLCQQHLRSLARMTCWHSPTPCGKPPQRQRTPHPVPVGRMSSPPPWLKVRAVATCGFCANRPKSVLAEPTAATPGLKSSSAPWGMVVRCRLESADKSASGATPAPSREHHSCQRSVLNCCPSCAAP